MKTLVILSALCAIAYGSAIGHAGLVGVHAGVGYAGAWAHGAAPLDPHSGVVVDTPEVAHAKAEHLAAKARAGAHGVGAWAGAPAVAAVAAPAVAAWNAAPAVAAWNAAPAVAAWNAAPAVAAWNAAPAVAAVAAPAVAAWNAAPAVGVWNGAIAAATHDNGQWNGDNGAVWVGRDNGQWHGEGVLDGAAFSGAAGAVNVYAAGHGVHGIVKEGQWSPALWGDRTAAANALGVGHLNGQWNAAVWGDKSAHGHRWRRSAILAHSVVSPLAHSVVSPLAHSVAIAPAHSVAIAPAVSAIAPLTTVHSVSTLAAPAVTVGHLGLGHGIGHGGLLL